LNAQLKLGVIPHFDGIPQVSAVEIRILARQLLGLIPNQGVHPQHRLPVKLDETGFTLGVDHSEGVDPESLHHPEAAGDGPVRHQPHYHMGQLRGVDDKVPEGIMGRRGLGNFIVWFWLDGVDYVRELDPVLDKEDGDVVGHQVIVTVLGVEFCSKAADVPNGIRRTPGTHHSGKAYKDRGLLAGVLKETGFGILGHGFIDLEVAVGTKAPGMDHPLGDAFMIEVGHLLPEVKVLHKGWAAFTGLEGVIGVGNPDSLIGCQFLAGIAGIEALQLFLFGLRRNGGFLLLNLIH